jgi:cobalamin biosynthesis Mg chelatase CobN
VTRRMWAIVLWVAFAFAVWNVVFDRVLVLAGRRYVYAAAMSANQSHTYLRIDDWMRPAITRGVWLASGAAGLILAVLVAGLLLQNLLEKRHRERIL